MTKLQRERTATDARSLGRDAWERMARNRMARTGGITYRLTGDALIGGLGDRTVPGQPGLPVRFLGAAASVPLGPFHSAAVTGRPLLPCFLMRDGPGRYRLLVDPPWYIDWPAGRAARRAVLQDAAQRWAERLETLLACYPLQWHNFYDFWADARA